MGLRFRKSIKIAKGVKINLSKSGVSLSVGRTGLHGTINSRGQLTTSAGLPGTGVSFVKTMSLKKLLGGTKKSEDVETISPKKRKDTAIPAGERAPAVGGSKEAGTSVSAAGDAADQVAAYEQQLQMIRRVHETCSETIDWKKISEQPAPASRSVSFNASNDSFSEDLHDANNSKFDDYGDWKKLHDLSGKILAGDIDSYLEVLAEVKPFEDLTEYGSDFEVGTDDPSSMTVEFNVKSEEVVPQETLALTSTGKLSWKALAKSTRNDIVQDYVCACVIRIAREMFALLPVDRVLINAKDSILNTATGHNEDVTLVSVIFDRARFMDTDFSRIDPSDLIEAYPSNMAFKKTSGLGAVEELHL
ncbi:DUF4236 domain-containing protein [Galactobacillus timonensis]|uniref:DUF4236 domain-containing protein n=1 Tax=Galactobacillus timonensis TaxID=2041840 RepID=UPI00240A1EC7|nr:DUF4236 domain-containing protein [Galactobacillus timonensis]MDD6679736.1 DUF4236 domain-containing protein [Galactobacillus timonensis]